MSHSYKINHFGDALPNRCPETKLEGGLQQLHSVDDVAFQRLTTCLVNEHENNTNTDINTKNNNNNNNNSLKKSMTTNSKTIETIKT